MHELSLMQGILEAALDEARKRNKKRIREVHATVRESGHPMDAGSLQEMLRTLAVGTRAEEARMVVTVVPVELRCRQCEHSFPAVNGTLLCPRCRSSRLEEVDAEKVDLECEFEDSEL